MNAKNNPHESSNTGHALMVNSGLNRQFRDRLASMGREIFAPQNSPIEAEDKTVETKNP